MLVIALAAGWVALIIAGGVLLALGVIAFAVWAHQYTKVGPNEVLIISGRRGRKKGPGYRIVRGGGTYVRPFREKVQRLSLELMQFDVRSAETYTMHGVPVQVDGVCMVKVDSSDDGIEHAATQFLSRGREDIVRTAMQAVEGHMRSAIGALSIEDIYRERQRLVASVRELAGPDIERMGLEIVSLTIRNIGDKQGYLEALGRPRTEQGRGGVRPRGGGRHWRRRGGCPSPQGPRGGRGDGRQGEELGRLQRGGDHRSRARDPPAARVRGVRAPGADRKDRDDRRQRVVPRRLEDHEGRDPGGGRAARGARGAHRAPAR